MSRNIVGYETAPTTWGYPWGCKGGTEGDVSAAGAVFSGVCRDVKTGVTTFNLGECHMD